MTTPNSKVSNCFHPYLSQTISKQNLPRPTLEQSLGIPCDHAGDTQRHPGCREISRHKTVVAIKTQEMKKLEYEEEAIHETELGFIYIKKVENGTDNNKRGERNPHSELTSEESTSRSHHKCLTLKQSTLQWGEYQSNAISSTTTPASDNLVLGACYLSNDETGKILYQSLISFSLLIFILFFRTHLHSIFSYLSKIRTVMK